MTESLIHLKMFKNISNGLTKGVPVSLNLRVVTPYCHEQKGGPLLVVLLIVAYEIRDSQIIHSRYIETVQ